MTTTTPQTIWAGRRWLHFTLHLMEMVVAMVVGMFVLGSAVSVALSGLGVPHLLDRPDLGALLMATNMTVGMSLWMWYRRHSWASIAEMGAAMYLPFLVVLIPFWTGLLPGGTVMTCGHALMLPAMVAAMLHRREEYTRGHRHARTASR
jgi:hypothetical protein